jgi:rhamnogalacturonyl hydrolase YesR
MKDFMHSKTLMTGTLSVALLSSALCGTATAKSRSANQEALPTRQAILKTTESVNQWFMQKYADPTEPTNVRGKVRPSSLWTRAVYYEGLMALYSISPRDEYYDYTYRWCDFHKWQPRHGDVTRDADDYCCGQTYIDMYRLEPESFKLKHVLANAEMLVNIPAVDDWWWIDAIQMGMPYLAKLGKTTGDARYWDKMWLMYEYTRNQQGEAGMWNAKDGLWWRDRDFDAPYVEPNGEDCYWSRGNGWVVAALVRVMNEIPTSEAHYAQYKKDFVAMCKALKACQREDGFWNCSLHDATHFGGKETSGTALFVYGMAWGIRMGYLKSEEYLPVVTKAWNAMVRDAVHDDGFLGYVQGTGKEPKDGQPTTYDNAPDFEDYGVGCFLLAGSEVYKIAPVEKDPVMKK